MIRLVLLHYPSLQSPPGGVWWVQDGILEHEYTPDSAQLRLLGETRFASLVPDETGTIDYRAQFFKMSMALNPTEVWSVTETEAEPWDLLTLLHAIPQR